MIQVTPQMKIFMATNPVDFRKGIDGLVAVCRQILKQNPFSGFLFVFCNRRRTAIRILSYDGQGFWLCMKRLSKGKIKWRPPQNGQDTSFLSASELQILLWNGIPSMAQIPPDWRKIES
jgi:transposase